MKKYSELDKKEFDLSISKYEVNTEKCIGCKMCIGSGCPAIKFEKEDKKAKIDDTQCVGCRVCAQICPKDAIEKKVGDR